MRLVLLLVVGLSLLPGVAAAQSCSSRPDCTQIRSCAEADFYFRQCGHSERDGDEDGIPCEDVCGDTMALYLLRRGEGNGTQGLVGEDFSCEGKRRCGEMKSCAEAEHYLRQCGVSSLDGNGDGVPCESICR